MSTSSKNNKLHALFGKGIEALERRDFKRALRIAKQLHEGNYSGAFELEARARYEMGEPQEATRILEIGLRKFPTVYILASYLGEFQSNQGHYQLAIEAFEKARNGDQDVDSYADLNIGICYGRMEMYDRAAEYYAKVKFTPDYHGWTHFLSCQAKIYLQLGDDAKFLEVCEEGIARAKRDTRPHVKRAAAWLYGYRAEYFAKLNKITSAKADLQAGKDLDTHNEQVLRAHRHLFGRKLDSATCYEVLLHGAATGLRGAPKKMGMYCWFAIIAESEQDLVRLAQEHAEPWQTWDSVEKIRSTESVDEIHEGVTWMQEGGVFYDEHFGVLSRLRARLAGVKIWKMEE